MNFTKVRIHDKFHTLEVQRAGKFCGVSLLFCPHGIVLAQYDVTCPFAGGPLGELVQWSDVITTLFLLGYDVTVVSDVSDMLKLVLKPTRDARDTLRLIEGRTKSLVHCMYVGGDNKLNVLEKCVDVRSKFIVCFVSFSATSPRRSSCTCLAEQNRTSSSWI